MSVISSSLKRLNLRLITLQLFGNAAILLAAALWLEIPDSHIWELFISLLFGSVIIAGLLALHVTVIRQLRAAMDPWPLWLGGILLAIWAALLSIPSKLVALAAPEIDQRASYWNSQLSPHLRTFFTYERLSHWQSAGFDFIVWFLVPTFLLPLIIETISRGVHFKVWSAALRVLGQWKYWASCAVTGLVLHWMVLPLVDWQPGHSVSAELISVVLRLGVVYVAVVVLLTILLGYTASLLAGRDGIRNAAMQPVENHSHSILPDK